MNGVLPDTKILTLIENGHVISDVPLVTGQVQPASLDLRLGTRAYRVRASFLAGHGQRGRAA